MISTEGISINETKSLKHEKSNITNFNIFVKLFIYKVLNKRYSELRPLLY